MGDKDDPNFLARFIVSTEWREDRKRMWLEKYTKDLAEKHRQAGDQAALDRKHEEGGWREIMPEAEIERFIRQTVPPEANITGITFDNARGTLVVTARRPELVERAIGKDLWGWDVEVEAAPPAKLRDEYKSGPPRPPAKT